MKGPEFKNGADPPPSFIVKCLVSQGVVYLQNVTDPLPLTLTSMSAQHGTAGAKVKADYQGLLQSVDVRA